MEIANSTQTFSSKTAVRFENAVRFGVHEEHFSDAAAFIFLFFVKCLLSLKFQVVLIL